MDNKVDHFNTSEIVQVAKQACNISGENKDLTDDEIAQVCKFWACKAPDTIWVDGIPHFGIIGIGLMLSISLYEFPWFYEKHQLFQRN